MAAPIPPKPTDDASAIGGHLGVGARTARRRLLTVSTAVRSMVLPEGGYRLYGNATLTYYAVRAAIDATGTLATGEAAAPSTSELAAAAAGSPGAAAAWDSAATQTGLQLPLSSEDFRTIAVRRGQWVVLYVRAESSTNVALEGPFEYAS